MSPNEALNSEAMVMARKYSDAPFFALVEEQGIVASKLAAVLGTSATDRDRTCDLLRSLGYEPIGFELNENLMASLYQGMYFDLLVANLDANGRQLSFDAQTLRSAIGTEVPLLLIVRELHLHTAVTSASAANADFILAPCNPLEFEARLMRLRNSTARKEWENGFRCGVYHFHPFDHNVHFQGKKVKLKPLEFRLACRLFRNPGVTHSREGLFRCVWGRAQLDNETRTLDVHIAKLRKSLELGPCSGYTLRSVYNVGYQLMILPRLNADQAGPPLVG
jgi:DNA-binding response OmpR family regulator